MQPGDDAWFVLEASGWRTRALAAEAKLATLPTPEADDLTDNDRAELANLREAWREAKRTGLRMLTFGLWSPTPEAERVEERWRWGYPDGIPGTPEYEPAPRICNWCNTVASRCQCATPRPTNDPAGSAGERARAIVEHVVMLCHQGRADEAEAIVAAIHPSQDTRDVAGAEGMREACAKVADQERNQWEDAGEGGGREWATAGNIAAAIRALPLPSTAPGEASDPDHWMYAQDGSPTDA